MKYLLDQRDFEQHLILFTHSVENTSVMEKFIHFLTTYGYTVVFLWVFIEQIGIPVPALPLLLAAGALAGLGKLDPVTTILAATLAAVVADSIWYELGRRRGAGILKFLCKVSLEPDSCIQSTATSFERYGLKTLLVAKFVPGLNTISQPLAGLMRVPRPKFWIFDWAGTTIWAGTSVGLGMVFHNQLQQLADRVEQFGIWCVIGAATLLAIYLGWKYYQQYSGQYKPNLSSDETELLEGIKIGMSFEQFRVKV